MSTNSGSDFVTVVFDTGVSIQLDEVDDAGVLRTPEENPLEPVLIYPQYSSMNEKLGGGCQRAPTDAALVPAVQFDKRKRWGNREVP